MEVTYRSVRLRVRAPRVAILVPMGTGWEGRCSRALRLASRYWGGLGVLLLPVHDGRINEMFKPVVRVYDPDLVAPYPLTFDELAELEGAATSTGFGGGEVTGWDAEPAAEQVVEWASPFFDGRQEILSYLFSDGDVVAPLIDAVSLVEPGKILYDLDLTDVDPAIAVRIRMRIGAVDETLATATAANIGEVVTLPVEDEDLHALQQFAVSGSVVTARWDLHSRWQQAKGTVAFGPPPLMLDIERFAAGTAFTLTSRGLVSISRVGARQAPVLVAGREGDDFCLAQALHVINGDNTMTVVPEWIQGENCRWVLDAIGRFARHHHRGPPAAPIQLLSVSMTDTELCTFSGELDESLRNAGYAKTKPATINGAHTMTPDETAALSAATTTVAMEINPQTYADPERFAHPVALPASGDAISSAVELLVPLDPPRPTAVSWSDPDAGWLVDVAIEDAQPPARSALRDDSLLADERRGTIVRASSFGLTFRSHSEWLTLAGWPIDLRLTRPRLRVPTAPETFNRLLAERHMTVRPSQAGRLTSSTAALWPDLASLAADLRGKTMTLLNAFAATGDDEPGVELRRQRFLTFDEVNAVISSSDDEARRLLDRLLGREVLRRGLVLRCLRCNWPAFYRLSVVGPGFVCERCDAGNDLVQTAWKQPRNEPNWYYDLDQVVRSALDADAAVPIAAMARLAQGHSSMLWMWEHDVFTDEDDKAIAEIDLWSIVDGRVLIGEAKSTKDLATRSNERRDILRKILAVADAVDADIVCFATSAPAWSDASERDIRDAVNNSGRELLLMTGLA